ncbi:MAG: hypothetical protein OEY22_07125 [Candidatus Bathyarchaeota archaeon]|nr:hypothetical protein [Candidatus Bathyarchaeota archaeon]MDH5786756.1 hypothetical protein [Candidatus Bathyarchaeota archaeon]
MKESSPTNNIVALKSNRAKGGMVSYSAIVVQYSHTKRVEAHAFEARSESGNGHRQEDLKRHHLRQSVG